MPTEETVTAYHGTSCAHYKRIVSEGIIPCHHGEGADKWAIEHHFKVGESSAKRPPGVYVTTDQAYAEDFARSTAEVAHDTPVVVELRIPKQIFRDDFKPDELNQPDFLSENVAFRATKPIPAAWIKTTHEVKPDKDGFPIITDPLETMLASLFAGV